MPTEPAADEWTRQITFGVVDPKDIAELDGLTLLRRIVTGELPAPPMCSALDFHFTRIEPGRVVIRGQPSAQYLNPLGFVHGGWFATLLDSCMGCAIHTNLPKGVGYTTIEIKTNFVRALKGDSGPVEAEGKVIHAGRRVALAEGRMIDGDGRLLATGSTTCLILAA